MTQKLLTFFLIGRVQEYYFINITIVSLIFFAFHMQGLKESTIYDTEPIRTTFSVALFSAVFIFLTWSLIKSKDHKFLNDDKGIVAFLPLLGLTVVGLLAVLTAYQAKDNLLERVITSVVLLMLSIKSVIIFIYLFLRRMGLTRNRFYKTIRKHLEDALGNYQISAVEVVCLSVTALIAVFLLARTNLNPFSQYLFAYSAADIMARGFEKMHGVKVIKN